MQLKYQSKFAEPCEAAFQVLARFLSPFLARPAIHVVAGGCILLLDFSTGPFLSFPILFVIPVVLSSWLCSARLAYFLAVFLPVGRFLIASFVDGQASLTVNIANALIRIAVLGFLAFLVVRTARQSREIKVLQGLLSVCMFCKRIRSEGEKWEEIEAYITAHSEVEFSHGLCVECAQKHYGDVLDLKPELIPACGSDKIVEENCGCR